MARSNVDSTLNELIGYEATRDVQLDGDQAGAIFRAVIDWDDLDEFIDFVEDDLGLEPDSVKDAKPIDDGAMVEVS